MLCRRHHVRTQTSGAVRTIFILLTLPVTWWLGGGTRVPEPGAMLERPGRRARALPLTDPLGLALNACTRTAEARPQLQVPVCCRVIGRSHAAAVPGRQWRRRVLKMRGRQLITLGGQRCRLSCVEAGPAAWPCGPTHACQGVGRRHWTARAPADGRRTCGTTLGRGTRPALSLFWTPPCGEGPPPAGRRSGPHGRIRTLPGASNISKSRSARLYRGPRP